MQTVDGQIYAAVLAENEMELKHDKLSNRGKMCLEGVFIEAWFL